MIIHGYKQSVANRRIHRQGLFRIESNLAWWDYFADTGSSKTVTLNVGNVGSVRITEAVPETNSGQELKENDYPAFFETGAKKVSNGAVSITLGANPVLIEIDEEEGEKEV